jgi:hypothetical protein
VVNLTVLFILLRYVKKSPLKSIVLTTTSISVIVCLFAIVKNI